MDNETKFPLKTFFVILLAATLIVLYMQFNNKLIVFFSFFVIILGMIFDKIENKICYILFFVSWVYAFKYDLTKPSLYSILVVAFIIICLFSKEFSASLKLLYTFIFLVTYIFILGIISSHFQIMSSINFMCNYGIVLIFAILSKNISKDNYRNYFIFYAMGVGSAALVGYLGQYFMQINIYLMNMRIVNTVIADGSLIVRNVGLDIDPNYYALQILMSICVLLVITYKRKGKKLEIISTIILIAFGVLSLSKMYLISIVFIFIFYIAVSLKEGIITGVKKIGFFLIPICVVLTLNYKYFYDAYLVRFVGVSSDLSGITTGRSTIWVNYINEIFLNSKTFIFGQGISNFLDARGAHNIYLSTWYKMGLFGIILYIMYIYACNKSVANKTGAKNKIKVIDIRLLPMYIILFANFALDTSVFTFFPIHILLAILAINYPYESKI